jgi:hypothetical protein
MCMVVGNVSLEDWPRLTSSLGYVGVLLPRWPPVSWMARLLMTSLTFMFDWVPDSVCRTYSGKCSSSAPAMTSSAARSIRPAFQAGAARPSR